MPAPLTLESVVGLMQEAVGASPCFEPFEQSNPKGHRGSGTVLGAHAHVLHADFDLEQSLLHDVGAIGHVRTIRSDGRDQWHIVLNGSSVSRVDLTIRRRHEDGTDRHCAGE